MSIRYARSCLKKQRNGRVKTDTHEVDHIVILNADGSGVTQRIEGISLTYDIVTTGDFIQKNIHSFVACFADG